MLTKERSLVSNQFACCIDQDKAETFSLKDSVNLIEIIERPPTAAERMSTQSMLTSHQETSLNGALRRLIEKQAEVTAVLNTITADSGPDGSFHRLDKSLKECIRDIMRFDKKSDSLLSYYNNNSDVSRFIIPPSAVVRTNSSFFKTQMNPERTRCVARIGISSVFILALLLSAGLVIGALLSGYLVALVQKNKAWEDISSSITDLNSSLLSSTVENHLARSQRAFFTTSALIPSLIAFLVGMVFVYTFIAVACFMASNEHYNMERLRLQGKVQEVDFESLNDEEQGTLEDFLSDLVVVANITAKIYGDCPDQSSSHDGPLMV